MQTETLGTQQKALVINLEPKNYGTIAEIGGGQETARWFFRVGGAAGTIAKSISAYDMTFSDAIYGSSPRYVSRERLSAMLDHEYQLLLERLDASRGEQSTFFAFANTVATHSYTYKTDGHGWLGIRFQTEARGEHSQIDVHVNLHGKDAMRDQETLGIVGVNLIYAALHLHKEPETLLRSLMEQLQREHLEIDMVDLSGPAFKAVDNRLIALNLVQYGLSDAAMFTADGEVALVAESLWKKSVLVERSRFRPPTKFTMDLLDCAQTEFINDTQLDPASLIVLSEMTLSNLGGENGSEIVVNDFLNRADILCALGKNVLISKYGEYYRLAQYLFRYTSQPIAIAMGLPSLREVFEEKYYESLPGGILESFGRMFKNDLRLYVSPELDSTTKRPVDIHAMQVASHLHHLYTYLLENHFVKGLNTVDEAYLAIYSHEVLEMIHQGNPQWETLVPEQVVEMIKAKGLFTVDGGR
ncbi:MAG: TonB-dependent receptor [Gammaproteobacteria bacterium]|nr:TonB-dependent receptor [Gammaproteobacteria bacterium]